jgi:hypothetical protein
VKPVMTAPVRRWHPQGTSLAAAFSVHVPALANVRLSLGGAALTPGSALYAWSGGHPVFVAASQQGRELTVSAPPGRTTTFSILAPARTVTGGTSPVTGLPILPEAAGGFGAIAAGEGLLLASRRLARR